MKNSKGFKIYLFFKSIFALICLWTAVMCVITRFKFPELTETQILLNVPKYFMMDWDKIDK